MSLAHTHTLSLSLSLLVCLLVLLCLPTFSCLGKAVCNVPVTFVFFLSVFFLSLFASLVSGGSSAWSIHCGYHRQWQNCWQKGCKRGIGGVFSSFLDLQMFTYVSIDYLIVFSLHVADCQSPIQWSFELFVGSCTFATFGLWTCDCQRCCAVNVICVRSTRSRFEIFLSVRRRVIDRGLLLQVYHPTCRAIWPSLSLWIDCLP